MSPKPGRLGRCSAAGGSTPLPTPSADVFFEILSWLPLRSLSRSRCVCRSWRALISNPAFIALHRSHAQPLLVAATRSRTLLHPNTTTSSALQIMDTEGDVVRFVPGRFGKFRANLDNLVLLTSCQDYYSPDIRVIDIATGETIANCPAPNWVPVVCRLATCFGFGRATLSGVLKVVCIFFSGHLTCQVLTLGDNGGSEWRQASSPSYMVCGSNDGVEVKGALHFLSVCQNHILGFHLESEEWTAIRGPSTIIPSTWEKIGLAELNGALCIAHSKRNTVTLWLLTDLNNKDVWIKAYTIKVGHVVDLVPLRVMRPGGKLLFYYRRGHESVLQVYDPRSGKLEKAPTIIVGRIGLCSSHLDRRLRVEDLTDDVEKDD